jgi:hypothetical protein
MKKIIFSLIFFNVLFNYLLSANNFSNCDYLSNLNSENINKESNAETKVFYKNKVDDSDEENKDDSDEKNKNPWFTGPLLTLAAPSVPDGIVVTTDTFYNFYQYGSYSSNSKLTKTPLTISRAIALCIFTGIAKNWDFGCAVQAVTNTYKNKTYTGVGDCIIQIKHVLFEETDTYPSIGAGYAIVIPTGNYHNLDPELERSDGTGAGSWGSIFGIRLQKNMKLHNEKWLRCRLDIRYEVFSPVFIKKHSVYRTGFGAKGRANPGDFMIALMGIEYQITQNFVFAMDLYANHVNKTTFSGYSGTDNKGKLKIAGLPSAEQYGLAPALEYNFNSKAGIIFGVWFTIGGRNSAAFYTPMVTVNIAF